MNRFCNAVFAFPFVLASVGWAQSAPPPPPPASPTEDIWLAQGPPPGERLRPEERRKLRKKVQQKIQTFVTVELSTQLGLDERKTIKLSSAIKAFGAAQAEAHRQVKKEMDTLAELLDRRADDKAIQRQTEKVMKVQSERKDPSRLFRETAAFLSVEEQARMVLLYPHVKREVKQMMGQKRKKMRRGKRGLRKGERARQGRGQRSPDFDD